MPTLLILHHVPHERLGTFEAPFKAAGLRLVSFNVYEHATSWPSLNGIGGVVVMGGPMSVYARRTYPFFTQELKLLTTALKRQLPILGVCLGAQLVAEALGGRVRKAQHPEIGWYPLMREPTADGDTLAEGFGSTETVFQSHSDVFGLPKGATRLFSSPLCPEQGFRYGRHVYALQFHVEVTAAMIRAWMATPDNKKALATLQGQIDPTAIRRQSPEHVGRLRELSDHVAGVFVQHVKNLPEVPSHG